MRVVRDLALVQPESNTYVAVGVFDGVHRGHQQLIACMVEAAHAQGCLAVIYTFDPHPLTALGRQPPPLLATVEERADVMASLGLDVMVVPPFTSATVRIPAADFTRNLVHHLRMVELWAGPDFALGYRREGTVAVLRQLGEELGFNVRIVEPLVCEGAWVSSSRVREALQAGDIAWATDCLGRPYRLTALAGPGSDLGPRIGCATITLQLQAERLVPAPGVYACLARAADQPPCPALVCIRTIEGSAARQLMIEVCLLKADFHFDKSALAVDFLAYLRQCWELDNEATLADQVCRDSEQARMFAAATPVSTLEGCRPSGVRTGALQT
jgi:riboflavin kinase / FMN adenylyltransferase